MGTSTSSTDSDQFFSLGLDSYSLVAVPAATTAVWSSAGAREAVTRATCEVCGSGNRVQWPQGQGSASGAWPALVVLVALMLPEAPAGEAQQAVTCDRRWYQGKAAKGLTRWFTEHLPDARLLAEPRHCVSNRSQAVTRLSATLGHSRRQPWHWPLPCM